MKTRKTSLENIAVLAGYVVIIWFVGLFINFLLSLLPEVGRRYYAGNFWDRSAWDLVTGLIAFTIYSGSSDHH